MNHHLLINCFAVLNDASFATTLHDVGTNGCVEPASFSAILRIISALCKSMTFLQFPEITRLLDMGSSDEYLSDASSCYAWLHTLTQVVALGVTATGWIVKQGIV